MGSTVYSAGASGALKQHWISGAAWVQPHMKAELKKMSPDLQQRWLFGLGADQLVTVAWMDFWKGLDK